MATPTQFRVHVALNAKTSLELPCATEAKAMQWMLDFRHEMPRSTIRVVDGSGETIAFSSGVTP